VGHFNHAAARAHQRRQEREDRRAAKAARRAQLVKAKRQAADRSSTVAGATVAHTEAGK